MGTAKTEDFTVRQNRLAQLAKALAHPARIAILQQLIKTNQCICGDLVDELPLAQATISQHLKALKQAGIIQGTISGTSVCYCIDPEFWKQAQDDINQLFDSYKPEFTCC